MICPKCGYSEATGEECRKCGIIFAKFLAIQKRREERSRKKKDSAVQSDDDLIAHYYVEPEETSGPKSYLGRLAAQYFWGPYNSPWKPVTKWRMISLSIFFIIFIYLLSQETFYRLYPQSNIIDSTIISVFARVNLVFHEAGHWIFGATRNRTLTILGGSMMQILVPLMICFTFWGNRDATAMGFGLVWMFQNFLEVGRYMADARKPVLPLIGGLDPFGSHDWVNLFNRWDLWSYDTAIAKTTWTLGWIGIIGTVFWYTWRWLTSPSSEADMKNDILSGR